MHVPILLDIEIPTQIYFPIVYPARRPVSALSWKPRQRRRVLKIGPLNMPQLIIPGGLHTITYYYILLQSITYYNILLHTITYYYILLQPLDRIVQKTHTQVWWDGIRVYKGMDQSINQWGCKTHQIGLKKSGEHVGINEVATDGGSWAVPLTGTIHSCEDDRSWKPVQNGRGTTEMGSEGQDGTGWDRPRCRLFQLKLIAKKWLHSMDIHSLL